MTDADKQDLMSESLADIMDLTNSLVAMTKRKTVNIRKVVYVDSEGNDAYVSVYDSRLYEWKSSDTMDIVAAAELGSAEYADLIAYYNGISNESELEAGTRIRIPVLSPDASITSNAIYAVPSEQDNYGTDIKIDNDGDFATFDGDFDLISGADNLQQAILSRLTTAVNRRIRYSVYGIRNNVGNSAAVKSYLISSIEQTLAFEPRIKSVENITVRGKGDALEVAVYYTDINNSKNRTEGVL